MTHIRSGHGSSPSVKSGLKPSTLLWYKSRSRSGPSSVRQSKGRSTKCWLHDTVKFFIKLMRVLSHRIDFSLRTLLWSLTLGTIPSDKCTQYVRWKNISLLLLLVTTMWTNRLTPRWKKLTVNSKLILQSGDTVGGWGRTLSTKSGIVYRRCRDEGSECVCVVVWSTF